MRFRLLIAIGATVVLLSACAAQSPRSESGTTTFSSVASPASSRAVREILAALDRPAGSTDAVDRATQWIKAAGPRSPLWPLVVFRTAEAQLARERVEEGIALHQSLAEWASKRSPGDTWGGSGLAIVSCWRWANTLGQASRPDVVQVDRVIATYAALKNTRVTRGMFAFDFHDALPQLEEEILSRLAVLAWKAGRKAEAQGLLIDFLRINRQDSLGPEETAVETAVLEAGLASRDRLELMRATRLVALRRNEQAAKLLRTIAGTASPGVRAEAGVALARLERTFQPRAPQVVDRIVTAVLSQAAPPPVAQEAYYVRALAYGREGPQRNVTRYQDDLRRILDEYPTGRFGDDALYELARYFQQEAFKNTTLDRSAAERALDYFEKLRRFEGPNDYQDSAYFQPALLLYSLGRPDDLRRAKALLEQLNTDRPTSELNASSRFWQGRIAEALGDAAGALKVFTSLADQAPNSFYGLRAMMHSNVGAAAARELWPDPGTASELEAQFKISPKQDAVRARNAYSERIQWVLETGFYRDLLGQRLELGRAFPGQLLQDVPLKSIDERGHLTSMALLLALRQDVLVAADTFQFPADRLAQVRAVGEKAGDWPVALRTLGSVAGLSDGGAGMSPELARTPGFLNSAYPSVFADQFRAATKLLSGRACDIPLEALYAVARRESVFDAQAMSSDGALGLFQFRPSTLRGMDRRYTLREPLGGGSPTEYLLDPEKNIALGAEWFCLELLPAQKGNLLLAIMEHSAGRTAVLDWRNWWRATGRADDVEYMVETARIRETRILLRGVLLDMAVAKGIGLFAR